MRNKMTNTRRYNFIGLVKIIINCCFIHQTNQRRNMGCIRRVWGVSRMGCIMGVWGVSRRNMGCIPSHFIVKKIYFLL